MMKQVTKMLRLNTYMNIVMMNYILYARLRIGYTEVITSPVAIHFFAVIR